MKLLAPLYVKEKKLVTLILHREVCGYFSIALGVFVVRHETSLSKSKNYWCENFKSNWKQR
jgi:hypothetical protein